MVMMVRDDQKTYASLYNWLLYSFQTLPQKKPDVFRAFSKRAGDLAAISIMWGTSPTLKVDFDRAKCEDMGERKVGENLYERILQINWYGLTVPYEGVDRILVAGDLVGNAGFDPERDIVLEATILHELIHWCRKRSGLDVFDEGPSYAFEEEAYGRRIRRTWQSCYSPQYYYVDQKAK